MLRFLAIFLCLLGAGLPVSAGERVDPESRSSAFLQLASTLAAEPEVQRRDFAWIALAEIIHAYEKVLENSERRTPRSGKARQKLVRWQQATRAYTDQLHGLMRSLETAESVQVHADQAGSVLLLLDNRPVVLSGPEMGAPQLLEQRITDTYCDLHPCQRATEPILEPTIPEAGSWTLLAGGRAHYVVPDGLIFMFAHLRDREDKQRFCEELMAELRSLVVAVKGAERAGYAVDWVLLQIQPLTQGHTAKVVLNANDDYLSLEMMHLSRAGLLPEQLIRWLQDRVAGGTGVIATLDAEQLISTSGP